MNIYINRQKLDFELENEKNSHDILNQISKWLRETNLIFRSIKINGEIKEKESGEIPVSLIKLIELETMIDIKSVFVSLESEINKEVPDREVLTKNLDLLNDYCLTDEKDLAKALDETRLFRAKNTNGYDINLREIFIKEIHYIKKIIMNNFTESVNSESEIDNIISTYDEIKPLTEQIIELSRSGLEGETSSAFLKLVEYYQNLAVVFNKIQSEGSSLLESLDIEGESFKDFITGLNTCFEEIINAFENSDSILFTDIMEYEVTEKLDNLILSLKNIRGNT